jgi:choline dehydrogenase-like flavoprotein
VKVVVVGSGASGVHFALSALERGHTVEMIDVGRERSEPVRPDDTFEELKRTLDDPVAHFLGRDFEAVTLPGPGGEYYGFPPNKRYVFEGTEALRASTRGFAPLVSFAQGGLCEAWTGGVFPFTNGELAEFPFSYEEILPRYELVAERIGICGVEDDLAPWFPAHRHLLPPLDIDEHSGRLLARYRGCRERLLRELGFRMGRSRIATLSRDSGGRKACGYLGRCLTGCPTDSLYTPLDTLRRCREHSRFTYRGGLRARHFEADADGRIERLTCDPADGGESVIVPVERLVLAAGTLATGKVFLESWYRRTGEMPPLTGLMDNRQILMPFLNLSMVGRPHDPNSYQYHQLAIGLEAEDPLEYVHGLVTTLKTASIHPIVQSLPFDLRTSLNVFRSVHASARL